MHNKIKYFELLDEKRIWSLYTLKINYHNNYKLNIDKIYVPKHYIYRVHTINLDKSNFFCLKKNIFSGK